jgi:MFS family permease
MTAQVASSISASSANDADAGVTGKDLRRVIAASVAGSAMEWYDFSIYGTASALIFSDLFFPGLDKAAGLAAIFGAYAAGFFARPFGGLFFGWLGDKHGRKSVLVATVLLMGGSTFLIGLLPTWHEVGVWAAALLVGLRLLQGFGAGAEQAGASLIVSEFAPPARRGFYAALPFAGCIVGILLANGIFTLVQRLPKDEFISYGWRIPFLFSVVVIVVGIVIRMRVKESPVFEEIKRTGHASKRPVRNLMSEARGMLLVARCLSRPTTGVPASADCARSTTGRLAARWTVLQTGCFALHQSGLNASICQAQRGHTVTAPWRFRRPACATRWLATAAAHAASRRAGNSAQFRRIPRPPYIGAMLRDHGRRRSGRGSSLPDSCRTGWS